MKYDKIYNELKKKYTNEEIADAAIIPADLTEKEAATLASEMKAIRMQKLSEITPEEQVVADVMRLKFQIENYVKKENFSFEKTFGKYLAEYIRILKRNKKEIAADIALHYTKLSRIINDKETPSVELCYRLEKHSAELIKAELWWNLIIKKQGFILSKDEKTKMVEQQKVKNPIRA